MTNPIQKPTQRCLVKNEIYFYELDDRLKELESDYIITLNNEKVISITEFDSEDINIILENLK